MDIIVPGKRVTLSFSWTWKLYHTTYGARSVNDTVRLDLRNVDGRWLIREDLDKKIFIANFGFTAPGAAPNVIPPGHGTR